MKGSKIGESERIPEPVFCLKDVFKPKIVVSGKPERLTKGLENISGKKKSSLEDFEDAVEG